MRDPLGPDAPALPAEDAAPARPRTGRGPVVGGFVDLLAVIGGLAILLVSAITILGFVVSNWHDPDLQPAIDGFEQSAKGLPHVADAHTEAGNGDLGVDPVDYYSVVRLTVPCTAREVAETAEALRRLILDEKRYSFHPTVRCDGSGFTVSPAASTTAARMAVYEVLLTDRSLESAVLVAPQHADDPSPDLDDMALTLELSTRGAIGDTAARWRARLADVLPPLHVTVSTSASSSSVLENAVRPGDRSVDIDAGFSDADALIDVARHLDRSTERVSYFIGGDSCTIEVVASREAWAENAAFLGTHVPPGCTLRRSSTV